MSRHSLIASMHVAALLAGGLVTREDAVAAAKSETPPDEARRQREACEAAERLPPTPKPLTAADRERIRLAEIKRARKAERLRAALPTPPTIGGEK